MLFGSTKKKNESRTVKKERKKFWPILRLFKATETDEKKVPKLISFVNTHRRNPQDNNDFFVLL